jgi:DNA-binding protein H-NS
MRTTAITDLDQLEAAYQRTEQLMQEAAEAERAAFAQWQHAYGAYEVACDQAATARANCAQALIP